MRHHEELKLKELFWLRVSELVRLKDFAPNAANVAFQNDFNALAVVASVVEIAQDKKKCLGRLLVEQLQVDLENYFEKSIV